MADLAQLEAALVKADAAGDADGARMLATEVRRMRAQKPAQPADEPESMLETVAKAPTRWLGGTAETALAIGTGTAATAASGLLGLATFGDPEARKKINEKLDQVVYEPRTDTGKKMLGAVSYPFEKLAEGADYLGRKTTDAAGTVLPAPAAAALGAGVNTAVQAAPLALGPLAKGAGPMMEQFGRNRMQQALKPGIADLRSGDAAKAITTMLDEGLNVSPGDLEALRTKINSLDDQILTAVQNSPEVVDKVKVAQRLQGTLDKFSKQVNPLADKAAIKSAWDEFLATSKDQIPVAEAQELKQGTYRSLGDKSYGELKGASIESQKTLARGLKEEIAAKVPEIADLNAKDSDFINALGILEDRVLKSHNNNMAGLGSVAPTKAGLLAFLIDRSPLAMSMLGRFLHSTGGELPAAGEAAATLGAMQIGRKQRLQDLQK